MAAHTIETTIDSVAAYILSGNGLQNLAPGRAYIWSIRELSRKADASPTLLGKLRQHFLRALAQSLTPGQDPLFVAEASKIYGLTAITIRRKN